MPKPDGKKSYLLPDIDDEVRFIVNAFKKKYKKNKEIRIGFVAVNGGVDYMYAKGQILVRDQYLERVLRIIEPREEPGPAQDRLELSRDRPGRIQRVIGDVVLVSLRGTGLSVPSALEKIDGQLGAGKATPDHVLTVAPGESRPCPATEPQQAYAGIEPYPSVCPGNGGAGVLIYIADTGLLADAGSHSWLKGVKAGDLDPLPSLQGGVQQIPAYTGHGTFVAGVARCMAPAARVIVANAFAIAGSTLESDLAKRLDAALRLGVDIFHLSIATPSRKDLPLAAFEAWLRHMRQYKGVVCIVAAGNDGSRRPSWPAAFAEVVSVGALAGDWRSRASFSNFGGWVDVYAPGRSLVNAYATGRYTCHVRPYKNKVRKFHGMAKWSGTSFSTPIVTGLIAARMSRTGENGQEAAATLLAKAQSQAIPGVGAILLPCCDDDGPASPAGCCPAHQHRQCTC
jgi:subtilisin family serine protease